MTDVPFPDAPRPESPVAAAVPKAELHVHLEGTASPALVRRLAERNGMDLPGGLIAPDGGFAWSDFLDFLRVYDLASATIRTPRDYRDVTYDYLTACAAEGTIYVEVTSSPDHAAMAGMSYADHVAGIAQGIDDARAETGIEGRIIVSCVRHFGVERALKVVRDAVAHPHPLVTGFGMGGDEANHPPGAFAEVYRIAREEAGLACTVHAGEWAGPESIGEALTLPVDRLGHGVRAVEEPALVAELAERGIVLEVCPTSNLATGIYPDWANHPFAALRAAGVPVTLNSDDPPYFHTTIGQEYGRAGAAYGLDAADLAGITRTAIAAAYVDVETRARLFGRIDAATPPGG
jgi:adenosine deaminase